MEAQRGGACVSRWLCSAKLEEVVYCCRDKLGTLVLQLHSQTPTALRHWPPVTLPIRSLVVVCLCLSAYSDIK